MHFICMAMLTSCSFERGLDPYVHLLKCTYIFNTMQCIVDNKDGKIVAFNYFGSFESTT